ncbi:MAG: class I SAM-dependent methyltransferase [Actinomycetia bacterium]|nr:class I SAM-dependent methyltransferase [Actinomycetes bacterium]MCP4222838.1 class I SAM-dependent methyltransferase [Actinomycetes bacterium]MCP5031469.1 class I SAM-dependent methyltransferase [Actinomycetes bacterium]
MADDLNVSERWRLWRQRVDLQEYDTRWDRLQEEGMSVHGEASFVSQVGGLRVLDAGCGTGRVGVELARQGKLVTGVDNDPDMLELAKAKDADVTWVLADLATVALGQHFDVVVLAGDVLHYLKPGFESMAIANLSRHLRSNGVLVTGASVAEQDQLSHYDNWCRSAGLAFESRYASWSGAPYDRPGHYAVSVHRRPG